MLGIIGIEGALGWRRKIVFRNQNGVLNSGWTFQANPPPSTSSLPAPSSPTINDYWVATAEISIPILTGVELIGAAIKPLMDLDAAKAALDTAETIAKNMFETSPGEADFRSLGSTQPPELRH